MSAKFKALIDGIFRGFESPADTFVVNHYSYPHRSERDAMRSDWYRVGGTMKDAMTRSNAKAAS